MKSTFTLTEAQAQLPKIVRSGKIVGISRHNKVEAFLVPRERFESLLETMELMSNPAAMKALRDHKAGKTKYRTLADVETELDL